MVLTTVMGEAGADVVVVGAGVIGSEYACMFAALGIPVTLVDPKPELLPFLAWLALTAHLARVRSSSLLIASAPAAAVFVRRGVPYSLATSSSSVVTTGARAESAVPETPPAGATSVVSSVRRKCSYRCRSPMNQMSLSVSTVVRS